MISKEQLVNDKARHETRKHLPASLTILGYIAEVERLQAELKECRESLVDQKRRWLDLPGGIDIDADENNTSPEDAGQHAAGLAVKAIDAVLPLLKEGRK